MHYPVPAYLPPELEGKVLRTYLPVYGKYYSSGTCQLLCQVPVGSP
jgi:hypothetical protein